MAISLLIEQRPPLGRQVIISLAGMASLEQTLESILFISPKPLTVRQLAGLIDKPADDVCAALVKITAAYQERGVVLKNVDDSYQFMTSGDCRTAVQKFVKEELTGELTRPSLETLTVIAYRGPITKAELELIRGVNCSMILRNLLMRGLIEELTDKQHGPRYQVTMEFLRYLQIDSPAALPRFAELNAHQLLEQLLKTTTGEAGGENKA